MTNILFVGNNLVGSPELTKALNEVYASTASFTLLELSDGREKEYNQNMLTKIDECTVAVVLGDIGCILGIRRFITSASLRKKAVFFASEDDSWTFEMPKVKV